MSIARLMQQAAAGVSAGGGGLLVGLPLTWVHDSMSLVLALLGRRRVSQRDVWFKPTMVVKAMTSLVALG